MQAAITVLKDELKFQLEVMGTIRKYSLDMKEVGNAYSFSPKPGRLFDLLNILRDNHHIHYGTNFNAVESDV